MSVSQTSPLPEGELEQSLWQSGMVCLCRTSLDGKLVQSTPGFQNLVNNRGQSPPLTQLAPVLHPEDRGAFLEELKKITASGQIMERRSVRLVTPDGRVMLMEVAGEPWVKNESVIGATLAWWDKSDEESATAGKVRDGLENFQEVINTFVASLFDQVVLLNTEGRIVHINPPVLELTGYRRVELIGQPVAFLFENSPDKIKKGMIRFAKLMRTGQMRDVAAEWTDRSGLRIPVTISGSVIRSSSGELIGMVLVARDERRNALLVALEKKNQELLNANQELQRLDQMKDDVMSLVGHELRAPLANILGYAEFLNEWELSAKEKYDFTRIIYQESQHLRRLVNDILDLSRMEAGRMVYTYVKGSITQVIRSALDSLRVDVEKKSLALELNLEEQIGPIEFDPDRIQQVVTNIIHNAIKFSEVGQTIRITTEEMEDGLRVSVADQGQGIDPEHAAKIFNKFEQIVDVKHHHEGTGLGMPIAKQIIEEGHGGKIWFESPGKAQGTVFRFTIPERRAEP